MKQLSFLQENPSKIKSKKKLSKNHWQMFVDGASRNNPGISGAGIHIKKNNRTVKKLGFHLGIKTNNQAEYAALIIGLYYLLPLIHEGDHVDIISDSELLVKQCKGEYKVKHPELKPLYALAKKILSSLNYSINHILREHNSIADLLANKGIDEKIKLPIPFLTFIKQHELDW